VKLARQRWFGHFADSRLDQLIFLDEFGASTTMQRTHGRAPPGQRVVSKVPHGHWKIISTIAAMSIRGIQASASFDGATDREMFTTFVREGLAPILAPGQIVVMDNLSAHKSAEVRGLIEARGARLLHLPPYSRDLNPIEQAIAKIKSILRKLARRSIDGLFDGIGEALSSITSTNALHYIVHGGYSLE
jgi:transposase